MGLAGNHGINSIKRAENQTEGNRHIPQLQKKNKDLNSIFLKAELQEDIKMPINGDQILIYIFL